MGRLILSLDSTTLIDLARARSPSFRDRYQDCVRAGAEFAVSTVVMHELVSGVVSSRDPDRQRRRLDDVLIGLPIIDLTADDVQVTGMLAGALRRSGRPIGGFDTLIAGQALARGWMVVTSNIKHFGRVEGLTLIDWSVGPEPLSADQIASRVAQI